MFYVLTPHGIFEQDTKPLPHERQVTLVEYLEQRTRNFQLMKLKEREA